MSKLQPVRGTHDLLRDDLLRHRRVIDTALAVAGRYNYEEIATPIFEATEVFKRTIGETTDIVTKEMYSFTMHDGESLTLRPENTASVVRAVISNGLLQDLPLRFFYAGPMFRYERPQKGRQRQFHQIGVELFGVPQAEGDIEVIALGARILRELGVLTDTTLELNTLGDTASRQAYRAALVSYFSQHRDKLSEESRQRLERNPLRILDSKNEGDKSLVATAPLFGEHLTPEARDFFEKVKDGLNRLGIAFTLNPRLVRGLDYYCHTAFEFTTTTLGAQGTVMGGGRYDYLVETMGGPATPGVGWAAGIERLGMMLAAAGSRARPFALVPIGDEAMALALTLAEELRAAGLMVDQAYGGNLQKRMKRANKIAARAAVIFGEDELKRGEVSLRDLDSGQQAPVKLAELAQHLKELR